MFMLFVSTVDLAEGDNREILTVTTLPWILDAALLASSTTWCGGKFETRSPAAMAMAPETRDGRTRLNQEPSFMATSTLVRTLNAALRDGNAAAVSAQLGSLRDPNVLLELANDDWVKEADVHLDPLILMGLWPLPSQRVHTTPACITASRGYEACLRHLLERGADPEAAPGGECALHCACEGAHQACVQLLLEYGARPNSCSEPGLTPLHMCTVSESLGCAERLLAAGARLQEEASLTGDTPLHTASTHGLVGHVNLYLSSGAHVDARNARGETPLHVACMSARGALDGHRYLQVCDLLLTYGATVDAVDAEMQTPLLRACVNVQSGVVRRLLNAGADPNARGYCGVAPLQKVLQMADYRPEQRPERLVQDLLNHGAIKFWPGALHKVLSHTCASVSTVEVLLNGYNYFKVTKAWRDAVPEEVQQANKDFYRSLFALSGQPRRLQHLARCALRSYLGAACHRLVPALPIPAALRSYLLLEPQGIMH
uniref:Ankyrin repeat and SOCS box containing 18 n=1 Tax=Eptatretus burgeri TaxID=7764 RepID=A0A8C4NAN5_EPTBU